MKILLVEDDLEISAFVCQFMTSKGIHVATATNRSDIHVVLASPEDFDCIVLDRLVDTIDTKSLFSSFKNKWPQTPIIILSAISTPEEKTELLNMGADDYLGKPFSASELLARIQARSRTRHVGQEQFINVGNTIIDLLKRKVLVNNQSLSLSSKEFLVLQNLCKTPGQVWSKTELLEAIWGTYLKIDTNVVETTIMNLRRHLADIGSSVAIKNSRNSGYWIEI